MKKFLSSILLLVLGVLPLAAQNIYATLVEPSTGDAVAFATVSLTKVGETKASKYVLSDADGKVVIERVKSGKYTLKAELMGYKTITREIVVVSSAGNINLGNLKMNVDAQAIEAATITDVGNPIVIKKDTIEYNASSFMTTDNDMLEALLKKLPGIEVASDGTVTANGQTISKITIDGKTFFLDDPTLATKNIPAKMVEKVKVVEKKSDQAIFTGIDDGEEETVIDLSLKPNMMKGWFGNASGGIGHDFPDQDIQDGDHRWEGAAMVGRFTDKSQLSVILNGNNTNNRGFNDMAGSMMNSMRGSNGGMGGGGGGWGQGNGITTSWMGGINGAWTLLDGNMDLSGNYLYNGSEKNIEEKSTKETFKDDGTSVIYNKNGQSVTHSEGHRVGVRLDHKFTESTSILFEPQFQYGKGWYDEQSADTTYSKNSGSSSITNRGFTSNKGDNESLKANGFLLFRQRLGKPGRTISANFRYDISRNDLWGYNQSLNEVLSGETAGTDTVNQRILSQSNATALTGRVSYTEPLGGNFYLEAQYRYKWDKTYSWKDVYNSGYSSDPRIYNPSGETFDEIYSNSITNNSQEHSVGANVQYQRKKTIFQLGASYMPTITDNITNGKTYHSIVHNWSPQAMVKYEFNDNSDMRIRYVGRTKQPSTSLLMPVPDNSDPLNISFGNPYLQPYFNNTLRGHVGYTDKNTFFSVRGHFDATLTTNSIMNAKWYSDAGVQYSMPLNGGTTGSANLGAFINSPIAKSNFSIMSVTNLGYKNSGSYVGRTSKSQEFINLYYDPITATFNYEQFNTDFYQHDNPASRKLNLDDFFEYSNTQSLDITERLKGTWRNNYIECGLSGQTKVSIPWYSIENASANTTWNNQVGVNFQYNSSIGLGLSTDFNFNWYSGYSYQQDPEYILNAQISQLLFKNMMTIAIKGYDLFNQAKNLTVSDSDNNHQEVRNNTLGRYVILSLTFRFGNFGKAGSIMESKRKSGGGPVGAPPGGGMGGPPPGM